MLETYLMLPILYDVKNVTKFLTLEEYKVVNGSITWHWKMKRWVKMSECSQTLSWQVGPTYSAKVYMTIMEIHITSLQFHMNITPSKASLHYLWNDVRIFGIEAELFPNTRTRQGSSQTRRFLCVNSQDSLIFEANVGEIRLNCVSVCFFPFSEGEFLMLNCGILFNTCFGSSFFGEGRGALEFSFKIRCSPERALECSVVMACGFRT
jgi:hypothetical protein